MEREKQVAGMANGFSTWVTIGKKRSSKRIEKERNQRRRRMVHGVVNFLVSIVCIPFEKKKKDTRRTEPRCSVLATAHREMLFECYSRS